MRELGWVKDEGGQGRGGGQAAEEGAFLLNPSPRPRRRRQIPSAEDLAWASQVLHGNFWSFRFAEPKNFSWSSGLFFFGWVKGGQRSVEALPLAHPQGGGLPASPRDPEMASCTWAGLPGCRAPPGPSSSPSHAMEWLRGGQRSTGPPAPRSVAGKKEEKNWPDRGPGLLSQISCPAHPDPA